MGICSCCQYYTGLYYSHDVHWETEESRACIQLIYHRGYIVLVYWLSWFSVAQLYSLTAFAAVLLFFTASRLSNATLKRGGKTRRKVGKRGKRKEAFKSGIGSEPLSTTSSVSRQSICKSGQTGHDIMSWFVPRNWVPLRQTGWLANVRFIHTVMGTAVYMVTMEEVEKVGG